MIRSLVNLNASLFRVMSKSEPVFYAVRKGRVPGIYSTWSECEKQVKGFPKPSYRKFPTHTAALQFIAENAVTSAPELPMQQHPSESSQLVKVPPSASSCSHCTHGAELADMKTSMGIIMDTVAKLSAGLDEVRSSVSRLENSLFTGLGSKRSFSTTTVSERQAKRPKFDCDKDHFTGSKFSEEEGTHVYTDGGCFDNGRNGARAGIGVFWTKDDPDNVSERLLGRPTNNRAEIHAAVRAIQIAKKKGIKNLILHTDSQFLINGITKWIRSWKKNQWKKTTGSPVINQKDFEELDRELKGINVQWVYVRGHSGDPSNEEADQLAKQGAEKLGPDV